MDRFEQALTAATAELKNEFGENLTGLLFAGSAAYGTPMPNSDVDLYVLIRSNWRQRRNRVIEGVEVEMFLNPVAQIHRELDERIRPTVDMFARGRVCHDPSGLVAQLVERAKRIASEPPKSPGDAAVYFIRYVPSDLVRDVEDLTGHDPAAAELLLYVALQAVLESHWRLRGETPPKPKRTLEAFRAEAPALDEHVAHITDARHAIGARGARLRQLCELVLEPAGGMLLEGETPPEDIADTL